MAPGVDGLPAAESEVPVSEPVSAYLAGLPARMLTRLRLALRAFEWLPFPWRFSRMGPEARLDYLREMERSPIGLHRDLLLLLKTLTMIGYGRDVRVHEAVRYQARCRLREGSLPPEPGSLGDLTPPEAGEQCDVVVIGSGAGGAVAAARLAEAGLDVLVCEAGPHLDRNSYPQDPLEALPALYRDRGLTVAEGRPVIPLPIGRCVGGTTVINSGTCFRAPPSVLADWRERSGIDWAPDLEAEFEAAERFLAVTPVDVERMGRNGQLCMEGAQALGASHGPISRNAGPCVQCGTCPSGCELDAKRAMHVSYLPRAVAAGARIRAGARATRILVDGGRASGVDCVVEPEPGTLGLDRDGRRYRVGARAVVLAGGAVGTPELLLRSRLANSSGQVGRNLRIHPACWVGASFDEEVRGWEGVMQSYYVDEWHDRGLLLEATFTPLAFGAHWLAGVGDEHQRRLLHYDRVGSIGVHLSDRSRGRVGLTRRGETRVGYRLTPDDARTLVYGIARAAEIHFAAGAREVYPQVGRLPLIRRGRLADFESASFRPGELRLEAFHPMGTARMGSDPRTSVTGTDGETHDLPGLHIADASLFPTSLGVNPMMTVIAVAERIASRLAARLAA